LLVLAHTNFVLLFYYQYVQKSDLFIGHNNNGGA
jgi:hypothetical protein